MISWVLVGESTRCHVPCFNRVNYCAFFSKPDQSQFLVVLQLGYFIRCLDEFQTFIIDLVHWCPVRINLEALGANRVANCFAALL